MGPRNQRLLQQFVIPLLAVGAATAITLKFPALRSRSSLFLFLTAVVICTRIGGWLAGLTATILSALASSWFFFSPTGSFAITDPNDIFRLVVFLLISLMILSLHASRGTAEVKLRASEQRLMLALDSARMGVWDYNLLTRQFWWSKTLEVIYDRSGRDFANTYGRFFGYIHFDDQPLFNRAITRTIDEGTDYEVDHRIVLPDNSIRWVNTRGRVFFNEASRAERIVGIAIDITAKKNSNDSKNYPAKRPTIQSGARWLETLMHALIGIAFFFIGAALLLITLAELLWNTFLEGGPPISRRITHSAFHFTMRFCRRKDRRIIGLAGLAAIMCILVVWTLMIWMGWALIFSASRTAVVDTVTRQPADETDRLYFAGSTIFTLGIGDFQPTGHVWQLATSVAAASGFLMFGTALAYLMAVVPAATQKRQLAVVIWALGKSPDDIIVRAWNGVDSTALNPHLISLIPMLALMGESHLSYPILHYIHSSKRSASLAASVASLDEALTILECGLQRGCSLDLPSLGAARQAITEFLKTLDGALISPSKEDPPAPSLKMLQEMGVSVVDDDLFAQSLAGLTERRRMLHALVRNEGWTWDAVWPSNSRPV